MFQDNMLPRDYTIFVVMPAFNEHYILKTINSAIEKAEYPDRVSIGVWEHTTSGEFVDLSGFKNVKHTRLHYEAMLGVGFARLGAFLLYEREDFILQIDAHTIFRDKWDTILINHYLNIQEKTQHDKIIISSVGAWWSPEKDGTDYLSWGPEDKRILAMSYHLEPILSIVDKETILQYKEEKNDKFSFIGYTKDSDQYLALYRSNHENNLCTFDTFNEMKKWFSMQYISSNVFPPQQGYKKITSEPFAEHYTFAANFVFTDHKFIQEIMPDPFIIFSGEEPTTALRAWSRGYRIFAVEDTVLWHLNKNGIEFKDDRVYSPGLPHLVDHAALRDSRSVERVKNILSGNLLGYWGAPDIDKLEQYEKLNDFSFREFYQNQNIKKITLK